MGGRELEYVQDAFEANYIAPIGPQLAEFERRFCELTGFAHCVAVTCGTAAMHLALRHLGVGEGDVVIASTLTFIGSVSSVAFLGAELLFVDADRTSWNMDPELLERAVDQVLSQGKHVAAVIPTDLYGQCADYDRIREICDRHSIPMVVDAAESVGATYKDRPAGRGGRAAVYSFNGNKIITTSGGGILGTDDKELADQARWLSQQARDDAPHYEHSTIGYNYRMSNVAASIGLGQLEVLEQRVARRREIFTWYERTLGGLPGVSFAPEAAYGVHNRWLTVILFDEAVCSVTPEAVRLALEAANIESRPVWKPMHLQPVFRNAPVVGGAVSEELFARGLCLPSGTAMTEADLERVATIIRRCLA